MDLNTRLRPSVPGIVELGVHIVNLTDIRSSIVRRRRKGICKLHMYVYATRGWPIYFLQTYACVLCGVCVYKCVRRESSSSSSSSSTSTNIKFHDDGLTDWLRTSYINLGKVWLGKYVCPPVNIPCKHEVPIPRFLSLLHNLHATM